MTLNFAYLSALSRLARVHLSLLLYGIFVLGCGLTSSTYGGRFGGATPGGVQDMGLARRLIAEGVVPPESAFVVEGMFSEHDLPIDGTTCGKRLCLRAASGLALSSDDAPAGFVQLGLSSNIDMDNYQRAPLSLVMVVDVSGSMVWGRVGEDTPGEISRTLMSAIAEQLNEEDSVAIVTYGDSVRVPYQRGTPGIELQRAITNLETGGSTNMEAGMQRGIAIARQARAQSPDKDVRILLFTDEQPNVGATSPESFGGMVGDAADEGIGLTVFGMGQGLGQEVFLAMSHLRGGNGFSLFEQEDVQETMDNNWPWFAAPIAFNMHVDLELGEALTVSRDYGFPRAPSDEAVTAPSLDVSTVFLSRNRGALLLELGAEANLLPGAALRVSLSYQDPDGTVVDEALDVTLPSEHAEGGSFSQPMVRSTVALAQLVTGMREAAELYASDRVGAAAILQNARDRFAAHIALSEDESLGAELELADALLALMARGAEQRY